MATWKEFLTKALNEEKLNEAVKGAETYSKDDGIAIGTSDEGIYMLKISASRNYFSMSSSVLAPVTLDMIEEWERDNAEWEAPYYYEEFDGSDRYDGREWDELRDSEKEEFIDDFTNEMVRSKIDNMSGAFDWSFKGKEDEYYLDMISAGQDRFENLKYPVIKKKDYYILDQAWKQLHLKDLKDMTEYQKKLMDKSIKIYKSYARNAKKLLERSIQFYVLKLRGDKGSRALEKIMRKKGYKLGKLR